MALGWALRTKASLDRPRWAETGIPAAFKSQYLRVTVGNGDRTIERASARLSLTEALHFRRGLSRAIRELRLRAEAQAKDEFVTVLTQVAK